MATDLAPIEDLDRNILTLCSRINVATYELLEKALDKARDHECLDVPDLVDTSWSTRQADALVNVRKRYLHSESDSGGPNDYLVTIHVDQSALAERGRSAG